MTIIEDLATKGLVTATPDETVAAAAARMADKNVGALVVVEGDSLVGIVTERDLLKRLLGSGIDPRRTLVGEIATKDVATVTTTTPIREVLTIFREKGIRHVPVVDDGKAVGILSIHDFYEGLVQGLEKYVEDLHYRHQLDQGEDPYDHFGYRD